MKINQKGEKSIPLLLKHPLAYSCNKLLLDTIDNNRNKCTDPLSV